MRCSSCGSENPSGTKFCEECGKPLAQICPNCGTILRSGAKFCGECGAAQAPAPVPAEPTSTAGPALAAVSGAPSDPAATRPAAGVGSELRQVSVLFCDLVGFTPLSEARDPEDVRVLLSGYFELARAIVGRYGGIVEKFIGDAVMAVWGAPVAREDDAERAVRAGLELVCAVAAYGSEHGSDLQARVGVATGGVATTEAPEEGLVIGDRVNTAARIQSAAPPGGCYVDETTRSATFAAIAYVDAGEHELKGKAEPVRLYQATRVVAAIAGSQRSGVLEAPFVGRDHELRLVKELFHASSERRSARLVLVSGVAGVGKSRLAWEFFKYVDGLAGEVLWHTGRCLSYGEGVSYFALSEMVRARLQIGEEDPEEVIAEQLRTGLERWIPDEADREFITPRIGQLLGLPTQHAMGREELFSGWRLFFERLSEHLPVILFIEDLQWADAGMIDFLDHLLEWSGDHVLFLLVLSRPEGAERSGLSLSRRSATTVSLDPLADEVIGGLLDGLVSCLPDTERARIVEHAEGIPLYALETVRGLLDKGVLSRAGDGRLSLVGELGEIETPPGLTALIASRLDALTPDERGLIKECAVLGSCFPRLAIEAVSHVGQADLGELLSSLVRKEVLTVRADKFSPERGQYAFTQSLIRSVAYDMLTRAERKARHLRTAEHLRSVFRDDGAEMSEVIAVHFYDAYLAARDDPDSGELRVLARDAYAQAAERAEGVGSRDAAESAYLKSAELSSDESEQAGFTARAGRMAEDAGAGERAIVHFEAAIAAHAKAGRVVDAALVTAWLGRSLFTARRGELAITRLREALASLDETTAPPAVRAELQATLGGLLYLSAADRDEVAGLLESALTLAQHHDLTGQLADTLYLKGILLSSTGRTVEARALFEASLSAARLHGIIRSEMSVEATLADHFMTRDLPGAQEHAEASLALARRYGVRGFEAGASGNLMYILTMAGRPEEAELLGAEMLESASDERSEAAINLKLADIEILRGNIAAARDHLLLGRPVTEGDDAQFRPMYAAAEAAIYLAEGRSRDALEIARRAIEEAKSAGLGVAHEAVRAAYPVALHAAVVAGDLEEADRLTETLAVRPQGEVPPYLRAQVIFTKALVAGGRGEEADVEANLAAAETMFRELGYPYWAARAQLELAELLARQDRLDESAGHARAAATTFERLRAAPMLDRARALLEPALIGSPNPTS